MYVCIERIWEICRRFLVCLTVKFYSLMANIKMQTVSSMKNFLKNFNQL